MKIHISTGSSDAEHCRVVAGRAGRVTMSTKVAFAVAVATALVLPFAASAQESKPWIVGQVVPLTGPVATVGLRVDQSTQLWVEQVNAAGGIRGRKVQLINCNDENRPERAVACAREMLEKGASIILGNTLTASIRAIQSVTRQGPIFIIASPNVVPAPSTFDFQVSPSDEVMTEAIADFMTGNRLSKIGMVAATDASGEVGVDSAKKVFPKRNIELSLARIDLRATDASTQLVSVAGKDVRLVYSSYSGGGAVTVVKAFKNLGLEQPLIVSYANISDAFVQLIKDVKPPRLLGTALPGIVPDTMKNPEEQARARRFHEEYAKRYSERPDMLNVLGKLMTDTADAILRHSPNPEDATAVKKWLETTMVESIHNQHFSATNHVGVDASSVALVELKDNRWVPADPVK
jgi:branched-chain amino acid transport system substrate-binding protein